MQGQPHYAEGTVVVTHYATGQLDSCTPDYEDEGTPYPLPPDYRCDFGCRGPECCEAGCECKCHHQLPPDLSDEQGNLRYD